MSKMMYRMTSPPMLRECGTVEVQWHVLVIEELAVEPLIPQSLG